MNVDLVENQDRYSDVFPSESEDSETDSESDSDSEPESDALKTLELKIRDLEISVKEVSEERNAALSRLTMLENYSRSMNTSRPDDLNACINAYSFERAKAFEIHKTAEIKIKEHEKALEERKKEKRKIEKKEAKEKFKIITTKTKKKNEEARARDKKFATKRQIREERIQFWPKKVYRVVLSLDVGPVMTPGSSRRGSISSIAKSPEPEKSKQARPSDPQGSEACKISLSISYITYSASWSPRYDLSLSTTTKSGSITYRAEFRNTTSETWRDCKVSLSTAQTSFFGLSERIPEIRPWHIRLDKGFGDHAAEDQALYSQHELNSKTTGRTFFENRQKEPRHVLFHSEKSNRLFGSNKDTTFKKSYPPLHQEQLPAPTGGGLFGNRAADTSLFGSSNANANYNQPYGLGGGGGLFGNTVANNSLFGSTNANAFHNQGSAEPNVAFGQASHHRHASRSRARVEADEQELDIEDIDTDTLAPQATIDFQESSWEESGLTATYLVPGPARTIPPSLTTRRHRIQSIPLSDLTFAHVIVPKLKPAAFLKARVRNSSPFSLLRGPAGLTLDDSFLGNTILPRASPGEAFWLSLGVDTGVNVSYAKPSVKRSQSGVLVKEGSNVYGRSVTVTNTKAKQDIEVTVIDQVPVSQEERLKVEVLVPAGMGQSGGKGVRTGAGVVNEAVEKRGTTVRDVEMIKAREKAKGEWGSAVTRMVGKEGKVEWDVKLKAGQGVRLGLEYEARFPAGDGIVGVS